MKLERRRLLDATDYSGKDINVLTRTTIKLWLSILGKSLTTVSDLNVTQIYIVVAL